MDERLKDNIELRSNSLTLDEHVKRILTAKTKIKEGVFEMAFFIKDACEQLGNKQRELADKIGISESMMSRWISISSHPVLLEKKEVCPNTFSTLFAITNLDNQYIKFYGDKKGREKTIKLFDTNKINSNIMRADVETLISEHKQKVVEKKQNHNQTLLHSIDNRKISKTSRISNIKTLIETNIFFNTFVIIPTEKQLSRWRKLELGSYIHEEYPITELRNTTHTNNIQCVIKVPAKDIEVALRCLMGWGFTFKDLFTPPSNEYSKTSESIVIRGERGMSKGLVETTIQSDTTEDILKFGEKIGKSPYLLVGEETDNSLWNICIE